ncbi:MAG: ferredoxin--NADP reductase [Chitinophagaceae bacterium]|nr:ferredoxin--NADP reductase [Chitinophagaceae bacterium]
MSDAGNIATKRLRIAEIIEETPDTKSFVLEPCDGKIGYKAGQFLTFLFKRFTGDVVRRSYSMSSSPELNDPLTITVKRIVNGEFSRYLHDKAEIGDEVETIGASGFFVLPEKPEAYKQFVFLAAGSGITPVYALIKTLTRLHPAVKILLIYSNTTKSNAIFASQLEALEKKFAGRLVIEFLFSRSADVFKSRLTPESFEMYLGAHQVSLTGDSIFYVCGPADYMRMITFRLTALGVNTSVIRKEVFHVQHPKVRPEPPDTAEHTVTVNRNGEKYSFGVQYPLTILQAARLLNIHLPFSCETGQCGTCVAKCLQGSVWMAQNEVLLDEEIKRGIVLTCTGYPVYGDVELSM